jgi:hypothetical protein
VVALGYLKGFEGVEGSLCSYVVRLDAICQPIARGGVCMERDRVKVEGRSQQNI